MWQTFDIFGSSWLFKVFYDRKGKKRKKDIIPAENIYRIEINAYHFLPKIQPA